MLILAAPHFNLEKFNIQFTLFKFYKYVKFQLTINKSKQTFFLPKSINFQAQFKLKQFHNYFRLDPQTETLRQNRRKNNGVYTQHPIKQNAIASGSISCKQTHCADFRTRLSDFLSLTTGP